MIKLSKKVENPPSTMPYKPGQTFVLAAGSVTYVAVIGHVYDWACYAGPSSWGWDAIKRNGDKTSKGLADHLFPNIRAAGLEWRT